MSTSAVGRPRFPIYPLYIRTILQLLKKSGEELVKKKIVGPGMLENAISYELNKCMVQTHRAGQSDIICWDFRVHTLSDPNDSSTLCEIDFKFRWSPFDYDKYLAVEAKRLRGTGSSLAGAYVDEGVLDFINCKYGSGHNYGIMLGYVLVGGANNAIRSVEGAMTRRARRTRERQPFTANLTLCNYPGTHHSKHEQNINPNNQITLVHVFFDFS